MGAVEDLSERMRTDLKAAMRARDNAGVRALRTALAALANAEAPPAPAMSSLAPPVAGLVEHARVVLDVEDVARILQREIADRETAIAEYTSLGRQDVADELRAEVAALRRY